MTQLDPTALYRFDRSVADPLMAFGGPMPVSLPTPFTAQVGTREAPRADWFAKQSAVWDGLGLSSKAKKYTRKAIRALIGLESVTRPWIKLN